MILADSGRNIATTNPLCYSWVATCIMLVCFWFFRKASL